VAREGVLGEVGDVGHEVDDELGLVGVGIEAIEVASDEGDEVVGGGDGGAGGDAGVEGEELVDAGGLEVGAAVDAGLGVADVEDAVDAPGEALGAAVDRDGGRRGCSCRGRRRRCRARSAGRRNRRSDRRGCRPARDRDTRR